MTMTAEDHCMNLVSSCRGRVRAVEIAMVSTVWLTCCLDVLGVYPWRGERAAGVALVCDRSKRTLMVSRCRRAGPEGSARPDFISWRTASDGRESRRVYHINITDEAPPDTSGIPVLFVRASRPWRPQRRPAGARDPEIPTGRRGAAGGRWRPLVFPRCVMMHSSAAQAARMTYGHPCCSS